MSSCPANPRSEYRTAWDQDSCCKGILIRTGAGTALGKGCRASDSPAQSPQCAGSWGFARARPRQPIPLAPGLGGPFLRAVLLLLPSDDPPASGRCSCTTSNPISPQKLRKAEDNWTAVGHG